MMTFNVSTLPEELWLVIFSKLDVRDLGQVMQVCTAFRRIAQDGTLWTQHHELVRGILQKREQAHICRNIVQMPIDDFKVLPKHVVMLFNRRCSVMEIESGNMWQIQLPFIPKELGWVDMQSALAIGDHSFGHVKMEEEAVPQVYELGRTCFFMKNLVIDDGDRELAVHSLDNKEQICLIDKRGGEYISGQCEGTLLAVVVQRRGNQLLVVHDVQTGEQLFEREAPLYTALAISEAGEILFQEEHKRCGLFSKGRVILYDGLLDRRRMDCQPELTDAHFLYYGDARRICICSLKTGELVSEVTASTDILCAALYRDRFILYTLDLHFSVWDFQAKRQILDFEVSVESSEGWCEAMPNIQDYVMAIKKNKGIILVDLLEGRIIRRIKTSSFVTDLYFDGAILREFSEPRRVQNYSILSLVSRNFLGNKVEDELDSEDETE